MTDLALVAALAALVVVLIVVQVWLMLLDRRHRERTARRIESIRIAGPEVRVADLDAIDWDATAPPMEVPHAHRWSQNPEQVDATSRTFRCQYPYCSRVHTVHTRDLDADRA
jgi:heme/copper-type cytochrome/quinol oxidase subunit 2